MNTERLLELAAVIEKAPHRPIIEPLGDLKPEAFNMGTWHCGAVCCIGGWAEALFVPAKRQHYSPGDQNHVAWALGLDEGTAEQLFYPSENCGWQLTDAYADITPAMAAAVIRALAETGVVDWSPVVPQLEAEHAVA
jgi:hypothetical protein